MLLKMQCSLTGCALTEVGSTSVMWVGAHHFGLLKLHIPQHTLSQVPACQPVLRSDSLADCLMSDRSGQHTSYVYMPHTLDYSYPKHVVINARVQTLHR